MSYLSMPYKRDRMCLNLEKSLNCNVGKIDKKQTAVVSQIWEIYAKYLVFLHKFSIVMSKIV